MPGIRLSSPQEKIENIMTKKPNTVLRVGLLTAIINAFATVSVGAFAHTDKPHTAKKSISKDVYPWGQEGDPKKITRTININMSDNMRFSPDAITVKQGETIRFVVKNAGKLLHEMVIGSKEELARHAALMKKHPNMEHDEPYMAHVTAGKQTDLVWKFSNPGSFMFACLLPGHFEAGMQGVITVIAAAPIKTS